MLKGSQIMSLVWMPTIKRTIARMPGHLVSFIDGNVQFLAHFDSGIASR